MENKKDYTKGLSLLKKHLLEKGLYMTYYEIVGRSTWVFVLSELLAKRGICELFWKNTIKQHGVDRILRPTVIDDVFYDDCLFLWDKTEEGDEFWCNHCDSICTEYHDKMGTFYLHPEDNNEEDDWF